MIPLYEQDIWRSLDSGDFFFFFDLLILIDCPMHLVGMKGTPHKFWITLIFFKLFLLSVPLYL